MAGWKALPGELDPPVRDFVGHLRRLVDRSGLSVAAVADRTGHSRASWERYLDGRLLAPRGAVAALAEVTGADAGRLAAMRELAEGAWSRAEPRHEPTTETLRIARARAAPDTNASTETSGTGSPSGAHTSPAPPRRTDAVPPRRTGSAPAGPADRPPPAPVPPRRRAALVLVGIVGALLVVVAAVLLADLGGATDRPGRAGAGPSTTVPGTAPSATLPAGVKCTGAGCTGQDPETMGCGGTFATTVSRTPIGAAGLLEVRHSRTCAAAWARVTGAAPGDVLRVSAKGAGGGADGETGTVQDATVGADSDAYSPMVAVAEGTDVTVCVTPRSGARVCTGGR
ncbi:XRE family transcriptional regulator [Streptomyces sp. Je 1-79]|uniref:helix-turn-helix domain-containing protein n=1 Tax=Streptomyces sp. Je 1-79 TaxID=2943847 RepID=UPI0021A814AD|nr:XRE family transcriptional regulator [Streptomyces sp. Je 1-79]MCT4355696.1 XRE family transcriptional regulator [Streptomyces sp. Je 1-79]